ncbi:MAG: amidohydrolase [Bacteroidales bacterium]|nr:amidohydrolase [Bacteroidales bacterium]
MRNTILLLSFFFLAVLYACNPAEKADLVILNAKVVTIDKDNPRAEAIAVTGERIVAVGKSSRIEKYIDELKTEVIDAEGRLVIPGFNDAHAHFGPVDPDYIELRYTSDPSVITEKVKEQVQRSRPGQLIRGGHWEHEMFVSGEWPTKELIDKVSPDNPVVLSRADGHSVLVNSYVIENSGITKDTPDPFGGEIQRDPQTGEPTGIFKEAAKRLLSYGAAKLEMSEEEKAEREWKGYLMALEKARSLGITSIQMPGGADWDMYERLEKEGELTSRIDIGAVLTADKQKLAGLKIQREKYPSENNWIRFGYLKGFIDGTLGSGTALMFEPFSDEPDKAGLPQMTYEELEERVVAADAAGFQIGIHAIGTKANNWILDAYEKAQEVNGERDSRHRSEHAQILIQEDIPRFAELGVIASMQPTHCITDKRFCEKRIGLERSKGAYAWKSLLDAGAEIAFGTDYSVEPLNPMEGLYAAVTRKDRLGEEGEGWFPEEKLSMEKSIELYTLGSAYAQFMEDRKGMIKSGYLADIVITDRDLMTVPEEEIMKTTVDYTIVGGKVVYSKGN